MFAVYDLKLFADCQICQKPQIKIGKKQPPSESDPVRTTIFDFLIITSIKLHFIFKKKDHRRQFVTHSNFFLEVVMKNVHVYIQKFRSTLLGSGKQVRT